MHKTRSQTLLEKRPLVLRVLLLAILAAALLLVRAMLPVGSEAAPIVVTVNDASNTDDGSCDSTGPGDCTLNEAIDAANAGGIDVIEFDPSVFPPGSPTTISLDADLAVAVPFLTETGVKISAAGAGVIVDHGAGAVGNGDGDEEIGLGVEAGHDNFDFAITGGGGEDADGSIKFTGFKDHGIQVCGAATIDFVCDDFTLDEITINNVTVSDIGSGGSFDTGIAVWGKNLGNVSVSNNTVDLGTDASFGIRVAANLTDVPTLGGGADISDNSVDIEGNTVTGADVGVQVDMWGDLASDIDVCVCEGNEITAGFGDAVFLEYDGDIINSSVSYAVDNNGSIFGTGDGVEINIDADYGGATGSSAADVDSSVSGNETIEGTGTFAGGATDGMGVRVVVDVGDAASNSSSTVDVDSNGSLTDDITGGEGPGVYVYNYVCCGNTNTSDVSVSANWDIKGSTLGVQIHSYPSGTADNSNGHRSFVNVDNNDDITGDGGDGVYVDSMAGLDWSTGTPHTAHNNRSEVSVSGNDDITGKTGHGVYVMSSAGTPDDDGDNNHSVINVDDNTGKIVGGDGLDNDVDSGGDGIHLDHAATGAVVPTSDSNTTVLTVKNNQDDIIGDDTGIQAGAVVCCDPANTNSIEISGNSGSIIGDTEDGIRLAGDLDNFLNASGSFPFAVTDICCSQNTITIQNNATGFGETITGGNGSSSDHGIEIESHVDLASTGTPSSNLITLSGNDISGASTGDGVNFCCGDIGGSTFSGNVITSNGEDGIDIETPSSGDGVTFSGNDISSNGEQGVEIDGGDYPNLSFTSNNGGFSDNSDEGVDIDVADMPGFIFTDNIVDGNAEEGVELQADDLTGMIFTGNTITDNGTSNTDHGLDIEDADDIGGSRITGNTFARNTGDGLQSDAEAGASTTISNNDIFENGDEGLTLDPDSAGPASYAGTVISNNRIFDNSGSGIRITDASEMTIGPDNAISGNGPGTGIRIEGDDADRVTISQNRIWDNDGLGVDLVNTGGGGADLVGCTPDGPNECIDPPVFTGIAGDKLVGTACPLCDIDVYAADNEPPDQFNHGEGKDPQAKATADILGNFSVDLGCSKDGGLMTAIATDAAGNSSEFAGNFPIPDTTACTPTPTNTATATNTVVSPPATATATTEVVAEPGSITICKDTDPETVDEAFDFAGDIGFFDLEDDDCVEVNNLDSGESYSITEDEPSGWDLTAIDCFGTSSSNISVSLAAERVTIDLKAGEDVSCRFNNESTEPVVELGIITICKDTDPESSDIEFDFDGDLGDIDLEDDGCEEFDELDADDYTVTENETSGWSLTDIDCLGTSSANIDVDLDHQSVAIDLEDGDDVECTFTNTEEATATPTATSTATSTATATATRTSVPPTNTSVPPTNTSVPPTNTSVPPTATRTSVPPTATNTPVTPVEVKPPLGDVNGDGLVNSIDATLIDQFIAGLISSLPYENNADVNEDGDIDARDSALVLQYEAGLIPTLPPPAASGVAGLLAWSW